MEFVGDQVHKILGLTPCHIFCLQVTLVIILENKNINKYLTLTTGC
jgi:hypothetical protein